MTQGMDTQEEIVRLLALLIRRQGDSQAGTIRELNKSGFGPSRIAQLLGTTPNTVNVALSNAKKQGAKKDRSGGKAKSDSA